MPACLQAARLSEEVSSLASREETAVAVGHVLQSQLLEAGSAKLLLEQDKEEAEQAVQQLQQQLESVSAELQQSCAAFEELSREHAGMQEECSTMAAQLHEEGGCRQQVSWQVLAYHACMYGIIQWLPRVCYAGWIYHLSVTQHGVSGISYSMEPRRMYTAGAGYGQASQARNPVSNRKP